VVGGLIAFRRRRQQPGGTGEGEATPAPEAAGPAGDGSGT
jgi:hypothetical protein